MWRDMSKVKVKLNRAGVRELLKSEGIARECEKHASATLSAASSSAVGYTMGKRDYPERTGYAVYAEEYPAISDNLQNNTLLKSMQ